MPDVAGLATRPRIDQVGDAALLLTLGDEVAPAVNDLVHRVVAELGPAGVATTGAATMGLGTPVPAYASVLVPFDPDVMPEAAVRATIRAALGRAVGGPAPAPGPLVEIPVRYGGPDGPDLAEVAERTGHSEAEVVALHAGHEYRVYLVGFVPGFPYLGVLPAELELPRRTTPRVRVPAGSVAIAGRQTGIYPSPTPGGWHLIGRTDAPIWDARRNPPALLAPGDRVLFVPA
jgi:KipI family sensor histidine kinase inhibitor